MMLQIDGSSFRKHALMDHVQKYVQKLPPAMIVMALRCLTMAARFILTLFIATYMGFTALGEYGLIAGLIAVLPTILSFGLINRISRDAVTVALAQTTEALLQYWRMLIFLYLILSSLACVLVAGDGSLYLVIEVTVLALTEHVSGDGFVVLTMVERPLLANVMMCARLGLAALAFMVAAALIPDLCSVQALVATFVIANLVSLSVFFIATANWPWKYALFSWRTHRLREDFRHSLALYIADVMNVASQYLDRLLVSFYLGLELTGVYVLFWSVGNALATLESTGVLFIRRPSIIRAQQDQPAIAIVLLKKLIKSTTISSVCLGTIAAAALYLLLPMLNKPLALANISVLWLIVAGFIIRMIYEAVGIGLYSRRQDHLILISALSVLTATCALDLLLIPILNLNGACLALILAYGIGCGLRWYLFSSRPHSSTALVSVKSDPVR